MAKPKITFHIVSLFPESFSYLEHSVIGRAVRSEKIAVKVYDLREFGAGKHRITDDKAYGGGPGMVMMAEPILKAVKKIKGRKRNVKVVMFTPGGKQFDAGRAKKFARAHKHIILICGHYEGIDERVVKITRAEKLSIGPYVLTGGELPAMVVVDAAARQIPGVLGKAASLEEARIASHEVYTRPEVLEYDSKKYRVPKVLLSGDHKKIDAWRTARRSRNLT